MVQTFFLLIKAIRQKAFIRFEKSLSAIFLLQACNKIIAFV